MTGSLWWVLYYGFSMTASMTDGLACCHVAVVGRGCSLSHKLVSQRAVARPIMCICLGHDSCAVRVGHLCGSDC